MSTGIIQIMKQAAMDAVENAQMCDWRYGTVVDTSPLKVRITNQFTIPSKLLVVPQHLTDYEISCTYTPVNNDGGEQTVTSTIKVHNALKVGDKVVLLRKQGGQSYFILDRI